MPRLLCFILIMFVCTACIESSREAAPEIAKKYNDSVVLYSTAWCGYCEKMRNLLHRRNIDFLELDIETSAEAGLEFETLKGRGIPMVLVDGRIVDGYAPKAVFELLDAR